MNQGPTFDEEVIRECLGPFEEAAYLGSGTFGECWRVVKDHEVVALKLLTRQVGAERFRREVAALARLSHPNVMNLYASGEIEHAGQTVRWFTGEFVGGGNVAQHMERGRWPKAEDWHGFTVGLLRGLSAMHEQDVVHRDLKPSNVALRNGNWMEPVILDLGLVRMLDQSTITVYPDWIGTVPYMSPEQLRQERAHPRSDIFAVGVMCYELATEGSHPFVSPGEDIEIDEALRRMEKGPRLPSPEVGDIEFIERLLKYFPHRRPSASRALRIVEQS